MIKCRRVKPFLLYHWAPRVRRKSILRHGLKTGQKAVGHVQIDKASYLCLCDSPSFAWALSGNFVQGIKHWDLWMVWSSDIVDLLYRGDHVGQMPAEYRTRHAIPKSGIWLVGSRAK